MLSVVMLNVLMVNVVKLNVIMLNVVMLYVVAPPAVAGFEPLNFRITGTLFYPWPTRIHSCAMPIGSKTIGITTLRIDGLISSLRLCYAECLILVLLPYCYTECPYSECHGAHTMHQPNSLERT
jgi:hypothetical protein